MSQTRVTAAEGMETAYGYETVTGREEKQARVNEVFHRVAERYDLMNDLMSGGLHRAWKSAMVAWLSPPHRAGWTFLDVAGGTGDVAFRILDASRGRAEGTVLDINASMLGVGAERAARKKLDGHLVFVEANAEDLKLPDASFDAYTIAFGIRNVPRIDKALSEAFRVLKPGGRFLCLEFSEVDMPILDKILRAMVVQGDPADRRNRRQGSRILRISRRIDPPFPQPGKLFERHPRRRLRACQLPQSVGRDRGDAFGLEALSRRAPPAGTRRPLMPAMSKPAMRKTDSGQGRSGRPSSERT